MKYGVVQYDYKNKPRSSNFGELFFGHIKLLELYTKGTRNMKRTNETMV